MISVQPSLVSTVGHQRIRHCPLLVHEVGRSITLFRPEKREKQSGEWERQILVEGGRVRENLERLIDGGDHTEAGVLEWQGGKVLLRASRGAGRGRCRRGD